MKKTATIAKKYLRRYSLLMRHIAATADEYAASDSVARGITSVIGGDGGSKSHSQSKMADAAVEMVVHADAIAARGEELTRARDERDMVVFAVSDRNHVWGDVLHAVYVERMTVPEAADAMGYSRAAGYRLHDRALEAAYAAMCDLGVAGTRLPSARRNDMRNGEAPGGAVSSERVQALAKTRNSAAESTEGTAKCGSCAMYEPVPDRIIAESVGNWGYCPDYGGYVCGDDSPEGFVGADDCWAAE